MTFKNTALASLSILFLCFLTSCGNKQAVVLVDNPTKKEVKVSFDNGYAAYVPAYKFKSIRFDNMNAKLYVDNEEVGELNLEPGKEYLLNPTRSDYIIERIQYGNEQANRNLNKANLMLGDKAPHQTVPLNSITIDSSHYFGYVRKTDSLLITKMWELGVADRVPSRVSSQGFIADRIKIFRDYEFKRFHKLK